MASNGSNGSAASDGSSGNSKKRKKGPFRALLSRMTPKVGQVINLQRERERSTTFWPSLGQQLGRIVLVHFQVVAAISSE